MEIFYIITLILLGISFMMFKKSEEKLNFIKWLIIFIVSLLGYNILIGMILGLLNITSYIWLLSIINIIVALMLVYKCIRYKKIQKYFVRKIDIVGILVILIIFSIMFFKDLYIYKGDITHFAVDSAIHYRAAKHYSDNLKIFINVEDKTFFNFNVMQPGAYINDGIFMNIINGITGISYEYIYQMFETTILFLSGLAFYAIFIDKIKTKKGLIASLVLFALYIYGYPYNAWIYGFSYLAVAITIVAVLVAVVEELYSKEKINKVLVMSLIGILGTGLIFSYCLFVPAIFASICIYCFIKDFFNKEEKKILKIFGKNTLIITGILLLVTIAGIGYLFIPSFFIEGQTDLVSALKIDGAIYSEKYQNFLPYIPFVIIYLFELVKKIKEKKITYIDIFSILTIGFLGVLYIGMLFGKVAPYYMLKTYSIAWIAVFAVTVDIINKYINEKIFRIDFILLIALYVILLLKGVSAVSISKIYLVIILALYMVLPELIKKINLPENKHKIIKKIKNFKPLITGGTYVLIWAIFVCGWIWIKAGHIISEEKKHALPNLVGIYYIENCEHRKLIDLVQNFNAREIEITKFARENLKDMTVENTELMSGTRYYNRIWATAMLEFSSNTIPYQNVVQDTKVYDLEDALKDENKKYIVKVVEEEGQALEEYEKHLEKVKANSKIEILFENENGYVAKINR